MRANGLPGLQMGAVAPVLISDYICLVNFVVFCIFRSVTNFLSSYFFSLNLLLQLLNLSNFLIMFFDENRTKSEYYATI